MSRKHALAYWIGGAVPLAVTLLVIAFLPAQVPVHFDMAFMPDRWGSKYELLLIPFWTAVLAGFLAGMHRFAQRREDAKTLRLLWVASVVIMAVSDAVMVAILLMVAARA